MKAEERAKMLVRLIQGRQESWDWHADNIASAIRSAENEALERVATILDEEEEIYEDALIKEADEDRAYCMGIMAEMSGGIAHDIRALKHKEP